MNLEYWMEKAKQNALIKVKNGEVFELKDLFDGVEWERLSKGDRIRFGKFFANAISERKIPEIKRVQKGANNHTRYIKCMEDK